MFSSAFVCFWSLEFVHFLHSVQRCRRLKCLLENSHFVFFHVYRLLFSCTLFTTSECLDPCDCPSKNQSMNVMSAYKQKNVNNILLFIGKIYQDICSIIYHMTECFYDFYNNTFKIFTKICRFKQTALKHYYLDLVSLDVLAVPLLKGKKIALL